MKCNDLLKILKEKPLIIDVRDKYDYNKSHIPNSINIDHVELIKNHRCYLSNGCTYYIICDKGTVSNNIVKMLCKYNYHIESITDGFDNWHGPIEEF